MNSKNLNPIYEAMILLASVLVVLIIDQISKRYAIHHPESFNVIWNRGILGGMFSTHNPVEKVMIILNITLLFTLAYLFLVFFLLEKHLILKGGVSVLYSSILSNSIDRIVFGGVVDFIPFTLGSRILVMNLADIFQQLAIVFIIFYITVFRSLIWHENELRKQMILDTKTQVRFSLFYASLSFVTCCGTAILSFSYFKNTFHLSDVNVNEFIVVILLGALFLSTLVFIFSVFYSLKFIGPIFGIKKYFENYAKNSDAEFKLRKNDYFKFLEKAINKALKKG